jgi:nucleotide sugar dehydrogenase
MVNKMPDNVQFSNPNLPLIAVQGIGFVGSAMAIAAASACDATGGPRFNVVGVELDTQLGRERVTALAEGRLAFPTSDFKLIDAHARAVARGNLAATVDPAVYSDASVAVVDINLDVAFDDDGSRVDFRGLQSAVGILADRLPSGALILIECTVPPGTCERIVVPIVRERVRLRGLRDNAVLVAHSYERVMPGAAYLDSIINFWRVYAGTTLEAADRCETFLDQVIDTTRYPLTRLKSTTASEIGKVLENSYRAATIAFMEEWGRFAERIDVDLFPVIDAIRMRPTHSNLRQPGFGVGGYCLTKDPLLAPIAARQLYDMPDLAFPFCELAVATNRRMPLETLRLVREGLGGALRGRRLLLLGVSYRPDVGDTRHSPAECFVRAACAEGAVVDCHDPLVTHWNELDLHLLEHLPAPLGYDAIVFATNHSDYEALDFGRWLGGHRPLIVDANRVLTDCQRLAIAEFKVPLRSIGRGFSS